MLFPSVPALGTEALTLPPARASLRSTVAFGMHSRDCTCHTPTYGHASIVAGCTQVSGTEVYLVVNAGCREKDLKHINEQLEKYNVSPPEQFSASAGRVFVVCTSRVCCPRHSLPQMLAASQC